MTTTVVPVTVEKLQAMLMVWDENHDSNVEAEARDFTEVNNSAFAQFTHDNSQDMQLFLAQF